METFGGESLNDFLYMFIISGFHGDAQVAAVDACGAGIALVMDTDDVAAAICDDAGNVLQLAGLVHPL